MKELNLSLEKNSSGNVREKDFSFRREKPPLFKEREIC